MVGINIAICPSGLSKRTGMDQSEEMFLVKLIIPVDSVHLGELELLQFKDVSCRCVSR